MPKGISDRSIAVVLPRIDQGTSEVRYSPAGGDPLGPDSRVAGLLTANGGPGVYEATTRGGAYAGTGDLHQMARILVDHA